MALLDSLNPAQRAAASHFEGPALVVAGAGSGKTRVVVHRIAHLIEAHAVWPNQILAVTFTNKAAGELRERILHLVGDKAGQIWVSTFHSAAVRILRTYGELAGLQPGFVIYDDDDQLDVLKDSLDGLPGLKDPNPRYLRSVIDRAKSQLWLPEDLAQHGDDWLSGMPREAAVEAYRRYQNRMKRANAIDFNDLLMLTVKLFREQGEVLERIQNRAVFIHVDEYQDTNKAQYEITRLLALKYRNLVSVGDVDQSIYKFRGADIKNIIDFQNDYPDASVYRLEENYRSSASILQIANKLIEKNTERLDKVLRPTKSEGEAVRFYKAPDHKAEAEFVASRIEHLHATGMSFADITILYRTNAQSRVLEEQFMRLQIPVKIIGGLSFYDRQEIKDMLALARLAVNPADDIALKRALKRPKRGIGDTAIGKLEAWAKAQKTTLLTAFAEANTILERGMNPVLEFYRLTHELSEYALNHSAHEFLRFAMEVIGYKDMLKTEGTEGAARLENLEELLVAAEEWGKDNDGTIEAYLDDAALLASVDDGRTKRENRDTPEDCVTFMTMHNAKGLEFKEVFIVGLEDGLLPHRSAIVEPGGIEEERRLFYVAITRAMERLTMTQAEARMTYGKTLPSEASRFLQDIPKELLVAVNLFYQPLGSETPTVAPHIHSRLQASASNGTDKKATLALRGGEQVRHPKFGVGKVLAVSGVDDRQEAMIHFPEVGAKKLLIKYANLVLVG
jgi:DNA helicase II / ATP-dependent DNA helicase PcrA